MNYVGREPAPAGVILVGDTNPIGAIAFFHAPPDGSWVRLNGQVLIKAAYPDLWAYAQTFLTADQVANPGLYKSIDATTFAVPKLDGLFIRSAGGTAPNVAAALGVKQSEDVRVSSPGNVLNMTVGSVAFHITDTGTNVLQGPATGPGGGVETRPANVALVPCVKALKSVLMPASLMPSQDYVLLDTKVAANSASLDFVGSMSAAYSSFEFIYSNLLVAVSDWALSIRLSTDNGATFNAGGADYQEAANYVSAGVNNPFARATDRMQVGPPCSDLVADGGASGTFRLYDAPSAGIQKQCTSQGSCFRKTASHVMWTGSHRFVANTLAVNAARLFSTSGNLVSGRVKLYGIR